MRGCRILALLPSLVALAANGCARRVKVAEEVAAAPFAPTRPASKSSTVATPTPIPDWVKHVEIEADKLCGVGVAGAAFDDDSPYPREMASQRAARNLAGVIETNIQEAIIDRTTNTGTSIDLAQAVMVDDDLVEQVKQMAKLAFWIDVLGEGPFQQKNFTYGRACVDAKIAASTFRVDAKAVAGTATAKKKKKKSKESEPVGPAWLNRTGTQPGGRLCAVGFSLPTFNPENTFEVVVEDVRTQLALVLQTLVSSYSEELTTDRSTALEMMTVATTQAVSKGAIVTDFWYDDDGLGPYRKRRTTYGWGCVYPVDVMRKSVDSLAKELPEQTVAKVRERAQAAFDDLDAQIDKHAKQPRPDAADGAPAPVPPTARPKG
ncbi:MAG: hypothetical protein HY903_14875 [Deltaproteobacteria bacterium]|nr:hypothetical protein [Deltaproteobacteria bacterium]